MPAIVEVQDLVKRYGPEGDPAVAGISFEIHEGEIFSLLGPNGAGKTTTLSTLSCLVKPSAGNARVAGHSIVTESMAVRRLIGVVPQEVALYDSLSARQNLLFWGRMYDIKGKDLERRVAELLERVGLSDRADDRIDTYSGGMKRRINIAASLLHDPRLIYMDEPTVGIDPQSRRNILDMVKELNRQGITVLYTTHYMEEAQELSDRVGILDHGALIGLGTQKELTRLVGENETLRLQIGDTQPVAQLARIIEAAPGVTRVSVADGELAVIVPDAELVLPEIISRANELGVRIRSITIEEPNLESVFLHLTGRALRD